jgi:hypothetical protein
LTELSNKALRNYSAAIKQAPLFIAFALKAHKAFTLKIN